MLIMSDTFSAGPLSGTSDGYNLKMNKDQHTFGNHHLLKPLRDQQPQEGHHSTRGSGQCCSIESSLDASSQGSRQAR